jgi:hypothetical protein
MEDKLGSKKTQGLIDSNNKIDIDALSPFLQGKINAHLRGMELISALLKSGKNTSEAATLSEVLALCGSRRTVFRFWPKVRTAHPRDWPQIVAMCFVHDRGKYLRKTLPVEVSNALEDAQLVSKHLRMSELYKVAVEAAAAAGVECPSSKWFERHWKARS